MTNWKLIPLSVCVCVFACNRFIRRGDCLRSVQSKCSLSLFCGWTHRSFFQGLEHDECAPGHHVLFFERQLDQPRAFNPSKHLSACDPRGGGIHMERQASVGKENCRMPNPSVSGLVAVRTLNPSASKRYLGKISVMHLS